ncbi:MAG: ArsR family transcriptional regulator [Candidatus Lokiarchaeota archaeon]|nr:ArsR family transcriptional regulator [Candidatus Lokiarchaeota archaeon]
MDDEPDLFELMRILGNETRRKILEMLSERPRYLTDLSKELDKGQQAILRHLEDLENCGFLESFIEKRGQKSVGRSKKFYKITQSKRILIDISPNMFEIQSLSSLPDTDEDEIEVEVVEETPYLDNLHEIEKRMHKLTEIKDHMERYKKLKDIEDDLQKEIIHLRDAKQKGELLLLELNELKKKIL